MKKSIFFAFPINKKSIDISQYKEILNKILKQPVDAIKINIIKRLSLKELYALRQMSKEFKRLSDQVIEWEQLVNKNITTKSFAEVLAEDITDEELEELWMLQEMWRAKIPQDELNKAELVEKYKSFDEDDKKIFKNNLLEKAEVRAMFQRKIYQIYFEKNFLEVHDIELILRKLFKKNSQSKKPYKKLSTETNYKYVFDAVKKCLESKFDVILQKYYEESMIQRLDSGNEDFDEKLSSSLNEWFDLCATNPSKGNLDILFSVVKKLHSVTIYKNGLSDTLWKCLASFVKCKNNELIKAMMVFCFSEYKLELQYPRILVVLDALFSSEIQYEEAANIFLSIIKKHDKDEIFTAHYLIFSYTDNNFASSGLKKLNHLAIAYLIKHYNSGKDESFYARNLMFYACIILTSKQTSNGLVDTFEEILKNENFDLTRFIEIKAGVTVNCLFSAVKLGQEDIVKLLIDHAYRKKINLNEFKNKDGRTILHEACLVRNKAVIKLLYDRCLNVNIQDDLQFATPLHLFIDHTKIEFSSISLFLDKLQDINVVDRNGNTLLHLAAKKGHYDLVKNLIDRDADTTIKNIEGKTPRDLAFECSQDKQNDINKNNEFNNILLYFDSFVVKQQKAKTNNSPEMEIMSQKLDTVLNMLTQLTQQNTQLVQLNVGLQQNMTDLTKEVKRLTETVEKQGETINNQGQKIRLMELERQQNSVPSDNSTEKRSSSPTFPTLFKQV